MKYLPKLEAFSRHVILVVKINCSTLNNNMVTADIAPIGLQKIMFLTCLCLSSRYVAACPTCLHAREASYAP